MRALVTSLLLCIAAEAGAENVAWKRGLWFDGSRFAPGTRYSVDGVFVERRPVRIDRVVDLGERHVVPAFGDAHHHGLDSAASLDDKIAAFLEAGIFYVKNPNAVAQLLTPEARRKLNQPDTVDVSFSNGGLTATGGHPAPLHAYLASIGVFPGLGPEDMEDRAYFLVDDEAALEAKWPRILESRPDFIKTFLLFSEEFAERRGRPGAHKGLDPKLLPSIVRRAHAAGLRVSTHVDTAADFRHAVEAGVDEVNHLPQPDPRFSPDLSAYVIDPATARFAAAKGVVVVSTASTMERLSGGALPAGWVAAMRDNQRANVRTLLDAGVAIAIGSDGISGERTFATGRDEVRFLAAHRVADNLAILRMWAVEAPRTIFPKRRVGGLGVGYEASFLALACDPLDDLSCTERISMRVKKGLVLPPMGGPVILRRG